MIKEVIGIDPVSWQRPRFNGNRAFTASVVTQYKNAVIMMLKSRAPKVPLDQPIKVTLHFVLVPPKSKPRHKSLYPRVRPDIDNYAKVILDALNGIYWTDDGIICELTIKKFYDWTTKKGRLELMIEGLDESQAHLTVLK